MNQTGIKQILIPQSHLNGFSTQMNYDLIDIIKGF